MKKAKWYNWTSDPDWNRYCSDGAVIIGLCIFLIALMFTLSATAAPIDEPTPFDHSTCQYPDRTTNPPNGCDNSDPCDPANAAKGGSGECSKPETNEKPTPKPVIEPKKVPVNQCGGK